MRQALQAEGRLPSDAKGMRRPGRPRRSPPDEATET
jgi:hypothetical protein